VTRARLLLLAAAIAAAACATGGKLRENAEVIRSDIDKAKRSGAVRCAPKELALAEANVHFSEEEVAFGHANRANEHIALAEKHVKEALRLSKTCGPTQVLIAKKAPEPPPTPEPTKRIVEIEKTDRDADGVPDLDDACPDLAGNPEFKGCPDGDGDGVPDAEDACPQQAGPKETQGCPVAKDTDGDAIPDDIDRCPLDPEDRDGFQDEDGCPDPDNDGDGIVDRADACPTEPGSLENRGCPVTDKDHDGVPDGEDRCPEVAGLKEFAGCPDADADGIQDAEDKCPTQAGPKENGGCPDQDRDGDTLSDRLDKCPDQFGPPPDGCPKKYTLVEVKKEKIEIRQQVHFATAKFRVLPDSFALLNQVVQVLNDFSKMRLSIEGHTDNVGGEAGNMRLSQRRAEAVRDYLVAKGVSPARLEAIGFGPTKPIASTKTARGKGQNRRTEFRIVALE
jgi:OmpA-OmpF porin, OOP family